MIGPGSDKKDTTLSLIGLGMGSRGNLQPEEEFGRGQWMSKIQEKKNPIANNNTETPPTPSVNSISGPQYAPGMGGKSQQ